jgi:hypothetical protein
MWGLTLDNILSISSFIFYEYGASSYTPTDLVLANGTITKASKDVNPDLFWVLQSY